jgi:large subunit ribosomal protein L25
MLDWFLAYYTENQAVHFSAEVMAFKNLVYTQTLTVEIDLGNGKSFNFVQDIQVHPVSDKFFLLTFQIFDDKEIYGSSCENC